ncbi:MAG: retropepsin-like aspartic protease [Candidatus Omnitrophota bacterium]
MGIIISILVLSFLLCGAVSADVLYLRNGRHIEGIIKSDDGERVELDVGFGTVKFDWNTIEKVEKSSFEEIQRMREEWIGQKAAELQKKQETQEVDFSQDMGHILVEAVINNKVKASLMLDTGASVVLLSNRIAQQLGIDSDGGQKSNVKVMLADGRKIEAGYVLLDSVVVENVETKNVEAVVLGQDTGTTIMGDGLLGMSFLKRFNFQIDNEHKKLILQPK